MPHTDASPTDAELLAALAPLTPQDRDLLLDFAQLMAEAKRAGEFDAFAATARAIFAHAKTRMTGTP